MLVQSFVPFRASLDPPRPTRPVLNLGGRQSGEQELVHMNHCLENKNLKGQPPKTPKSL